MTTEQQEIGALIRAKRKEKKLTLAQLGELLGLGQMAISHYEKGDIKVIPFEKRLKLAEILNINIKSMLYQSEKFGTIFPSKSPVSVSHDITNLKTIKANSQLINIFMELFLFPDFQAYLDEKLKDSYPDSTKDIRRDMIDKALKSMLNTLLNKSAPEHDSLSNGIASIIDNLNKSTNDTDRNTKK